MNDKQKQIEEMANDIIDNAVLDDICANYGNDTFFADCHTVAERLYDLDYRKQKEVIMQIDLGDCTPELIKEITEQFNKAVATPLVPIPKSEEQIRKETAMDILKKWWKNNIATVNEDSNDYVEEIVYEYGINYNDFRREVDE